MIHKKERILFVGPYPPPYAGPEASMKCLLESPLTERFDVSFLNTNFRTSNPQRGVIDLSLVRAFFVFIQRLAFRLVSHRPKVVYAFVTATRLGWLGRDVWCIALSRLFGAHVVIHMRAGHFRRNFEGGGRLARTIIRIACSLLSHGIVQSYSLRDQFAGLLPDHRVLSIYNAIDTDTYCDDRSRPYNPVMVLFIGHLARSKGYCDLLKVMPEIVQHYPRVEFHFAGTLVKQERNVTCNQITGEPLGPEDPEECFDRFIRGRYEDNYVYHGMADEELKLALLKKCALFVLPSYSEGFSMAVLEALSMGKPVVCTPVGALGEVVRPEVNGLVCMPGDLDGLRQSILRMLGDTDLMEQIGKRNATYVRETFSVEVISRQLGDCFDSAIKGEV